METQDGLPGGKITYFHTQGKASALSDICSGGYKTNVGGGYINCAVNGIYRQRLILRISQVNDLMGQSCDTFCFNLHFDIVYNPAAAGPYIIRPGQVQFNFAGGIVMSYRGCQNRV